MSREKFRYVAQGAEGFLKCAVYTARASWRLSRLTCKSAGIGLGEVKDFMAWGPRSGDSLIQTSETMRGTERMME